MKGTTLNTNKKGIIKTDYDYGVYIYYGKYESDVDYTSNGIISLDVNVHNKDAFRYSVFGESSLIEFNGRLEKNKNSFENPFIEYIIEIIQNDEISPDI